MAEAGYERVSTAAIAREAGTSESQLVRYFGSKAGLLETIFDESWAPLNPQIARLVAAAPTAREAMITVLSTMIGAFERDPELAKLLMFEGRRVRGDNAEVLITQGFRDFAKLVLSLIERGQKDGSFSTALKPQAMTSALLGAAEGMIRVGEATNAVPDFCELQGTVRTFTVEVLEDFNFNDELIPLGASMWVRLAKTGCAQNSPWRDAP